MGDEPFGIAAQLRAQGYTRVPGSARRYVSPTGEEVSRRQAEQAVIRTAYGTQYGENLSRERYYAEIRPQNVQPSVWYTGDYEAAPVPFEFLYATGDHGEQQTPDELWQFYYIRKWGTDYIDEEDNWQSAKRRFYGFTFGQRGDPTDWPTAVNVMYTEFGIAFNWDTHEFDYDTVY